MTYPNDAEKKAEGGGSTRIRANIYGERKMIALRMGRNLNERMMAFCNGVHIPANTYVNELIEIALAKADPLKDSLKRIKPGPDYINVSIRMEPELHHKLMSFCSTEAISANSFVCGLIQKNLKQKIKMT